VNPLTTSAFDLPDHLFPKADPTLIDGDERHFAAVAESLEQTIAELSGRLDAERRAPGGVGRQAMDRDAEIHRLTARLRALHRFGLDLCLGRMVGADGPSPCTSDGWASPTARGVGCCSTGAPPRLSRSSEPPTPARWGWRAAAGIAGPRPDQRLLGRGVHRRRA
jgi:hypothetical protein